MDASNEIGGGDLLPGTQNMPRPRIDRIFDRATRSKLVYVVAGAGYGKTLAVRNYISQQQDAVVRWVQLTESDNLGSRYWENLTHNITIDNPELADKLRELGFPETLSRFKQFVSILKSSESRSHKTFLVLDDFHLIHSRQALEFAERCAHLKIPGACVIIISRTQPEINVVSLLAKGQVSAVTEDELRFTQDEVSDYFKSSGAPLPAKSLPQLVNVTNGWALAIALLSLVLKKNPKSFNAALDTMKQNVFKLMETEAWADFPPSVQKTMARLSLISDLPLKKLWQHFDDSSFLKDAPQLASFVWFDSFTGQDRVHPLYWEFLESKQGILTDEEKQDTYKQAAQWCVDNSLHLDAVRYLARSRQFGRLLETLLSYPFKLPQDTCEYFLDILENLNPIEAESADPAYLLLIHLFVPLLLAGTGKYIDAEERCLDTISRLGDADDPLSLLILSLSYSHLTYIGMYTCTASHRYEALEHFKKSLEYLKRSGMSEMKTTGAFAVGDMRSFACVVGEGAAPEEFEEFRAVTGEMAQYIAQTPHNMYYGYDDLVACELALYENRLDDAGTFAHGAIVKAREKKQYQIEAVANSYLLRIALSGGDYPLVKEILKKLGEQLDNPDFWNRQLLHDLIAGYFYAQIGLADMVPDWLVMNEAEMISEVRVPVKELIICAKSYIVSKKYGFALTLLLGSYPREPQERIVFGELMLTLLTAVARMGTGDTRGALVDFEKAYALSYGGRFELPFVELGKELGPLVKAALKQGIGGISDEWLKTIDRKASVYAKRVAVISNSFKKERNIEDAVSLSEREQEVLEDLYQWLSREEIATSRYLSINTVHKIIQSIFLKLDAYGKADAIRIAIDKGLIG